MKPLKAYRKNLSLPYPESPCSWYVNTEDIEANIDEHEIEVDDTGMIEP
jgi:hypothetical protein